MKVVSYDLKSPRSIELVLSVHRMGLEILDLTAVVRMWPVLGWMYASKLADVGKSEPTTLVKTPLQSPWHIIASLEPL